MPQQHMERHAFGRLAAPPPVTDAAALVVAAEPGAAAVLPASGPPLAALRRILATTLPLLWALADDELRHGRAFLASPVLLGSGAALWFSLPADPPLAAILTGCFLALLASWLNRHAPPLRRYGAGAAALLLLGMLLAAVETARHATVLLDAAVTTTLTGTVERREGDGPGRWRYVVAVIATAEPTLRRPPERVALLSRSPHLPLAIGAPIAGRARLSPPSGPALPGLTDFAFSAYFDGIGAVGYFYGAPTSPASDVARLPSPTPLDAVETWLAALRSGIGDRIRATLPGDAGAFAAAIVTDERRALSDETTEALRLSGLAHIIAISGLNMALAAGIFFVGLRTLLCLSTGFAQNYAVKKIAAAGALAAACGYYLISGFAVSAERAFLMMAVMLIAVFFDRPAISLRNVALSALVILVVSPSEVLGPSFQMSFAATLALVAGYALWTERPRREPVVFRRPAVRPLLALSRFFAGIFLTSVIGGLSTALFSAEHFHRLATYGLPANLAAMPVISFIVMPAGLLAMLAMPLGLEHWPLQVMGFGLDLVIGIARVVASWGGEVAVGRLPAWLFPLGCAGLLLLTLARTRLRHFGTGLIAALLLAVAVLPAERPPDLLVAEDGRLVAFAGSGVLSSNRMRPPDFIFRQWQHALQQAAEGPPLVLATGSVYPPVKGERYHRLSGDEAAVARAAMAAAARETRAAAAGAGPRFACVAKAWCLGRHTGGTVVVVLEDAAYLGPACDVGGIVVTAARLRVAACRSGAMLVTGATLRRTGALEIRFAGDDGPAVVQAAMSGVDRPWTRHRRYDWRSGRFEGEGEVRWGRSLRIPLLPSGERVARSAG